MKVHPRFLRTLAAVLAAAGLWALIYFYEYRGEAGRLEAQEAESRVFSIDEESISGVEVASTGGSVALRRDGKGWAIVEPIETRADGDKVDSMLSAATRLRVEERLEDVPESELESFDLREPPTRVILASAAGRVDLALGGRVPVGTGTYGMKAGEPAVLVLTGAVETLTSASLESLRFKKIVGVDLSELSGFTMAGEGADLGAAREDDVWRLREPVSFPADQGKIRDLWSGLAWLEAERVAVEKPGPEDLARMGLDTPALKLSLETAESAFSVDFGGTDESGAVFVKRSDLDAVMTVPKETLDRLQAARAAADGLRDPRLASMDRYRLDRIEVAGAGASHVLIKAEGGEWRHGGGDGPAVRERVDSLLDAIEDLRASGFGEGVPEESPELTMTLSEKVDEAGAIPSITTIRLLAEPGEAREDRRMLSTMSPSTVYRVPAMIVQTLIDRIGALGEAVDEVEQGDAQ